MSLVEGTPAPHFTAPSKFNPGFAFGNIAGRYILLAFLPYPGPERDAALALVESQRARFNDNEKLFFGVLPDRASLEAAIEDPPWRWLLDEAGEVRRLYEAVDETGELAPCWVVLDPSRRVLGTAPLARGPYVLANFVKFGPADLHAGPPMHAPVLMAPRILEPSICRQLIEVYRQDGGEPSGVMRARNGKTYAALDDFKMRRDAVIEDEALLREVRARIRLRLLPEIEKAFGFTVTRIERYIVACYSANEGGYFRPHRDNTTPGTAHRKFACSINLNAEEFEGGDLCFPEYGLRTYRPPTGGAVVFSCSLLHEATPVTKGVRYATLPFLFDEDGERIRQANLESFETAES
ncbi:2OG-Fe(II) oxygenase [Phenylobacterium sp.]|uniref:2OG-Fe(II) oxygenase n=1 Tax=Phenylobacterium sp. TaxID=1871053 RepID=UPI002C889C6F|nr:2OG-Fe(II) oxygenase [Phenylobacterium sp.]HLZ74842.1 2OG-Fe(II) oxygenase [Phenylobacterium sp.]